MLQEELVADGQIDLSSPKYENHFLNAVLYAIHVFIPKKYNAYRKLEIKQK
jgi:hypothetical protein